MISQVSGQELDLPSDSPLKRDCRVLGPPGWLKHSSPWQTGGVCGFWDAGGAYSEKLEAA